MTPCPTEEEFLRFVDGALSLERTERAKAHVAECSRCREQEDALRVLLADIQSPLARDIDVRAHVRAVMDRLDRPAPTRVHQRRPWWIGAGAIAAAGVLLATYAGRPAPVATNTWQARGVHAAPAIGRDVGVQLYAARGELRPLISGSTIDVATPLTAGFRNLGSAPAFLLLFAVDARHTVHWISPAYARSTDNPIATFLPPTMDERLLETTAVLDDVAYGPLRVVSVITPTPAHVSDVESLEGTELRAGDLVRRLPGAEIRETIVELESSDGAMP